MNKRDTSGLWTDADAPDRSIGVAPPPRTKRSATLPAPAISTSTETPPAVHQDPPQQPQQRPSRAPEKDGDIKLLALSLTGDQMDWLRKTSSKRGIWTGELFEELFHAHKAVVASVGTPRRTRRRNSNYTGTRVQVSLATFNDFAALAAELNASKAALGRAIIDAERH